MVAVSEPFYGFSIIIEGFMMGVGRTKTPFIYNIIGMWMVRIAGTFLCTQLTCGESGIRWNINRSTPEASSPKPFPFKALQVCLLFTV